MTKASHRYMLPALLFIATGTVAQERHDGTAVVRVDDGEYTIPIECDDALRPEHGFSTEPARITRDATGRSSGVRLGVRPYKDTLDLVVSLDRYVAWVPRQASANGILRMTLDMSPASSLKDGMPVLLTYERWKDGERPEGLADVSFEANCGYRDPMAPAFRKLHAESQ